MPKIEIVSTPLGEAPQWVREGWIGIRLPLAEEIPENLRPAKILSRGPEKVQGPLAVVLGSVALTELAKHNADAHVWWITHAPSIMLDLIVFDGKCFRLLDSE